MFSDTALRDIQYLMRKGILIKMKEEGVEKSFKEGVEGSTPYEHILDG